MNWFRESPSRREMYVATIAISIVVFIAGGWLTFGKMVKTGNDQLQRFEKCMDRLEAISVTQTNNQTVRVDGESILRDQRIRDLNQQHQQHLLESKK